MTASINIQCIPTPLIAAKRGKQAQANQPVGITDENSVIIEDENQTNLVND